MKEEKEKKRCTCSDPSVALDELLFGHLGSHVGIVRVCVEHNQRKR